jgi:dTDP-4-dehydrorhamnose reductase
MKRLARRPAYSVLDTRRFEEHFGYQMPTWQDGLMRYLEEKTMVSEE